MTKITIAKTICLTILILTLILIIGCNKQESQENIAPIVDAGNDLTVSVGEVFFFNGSAEDLDGQIVLYEWDTDSDGIYDTSCKGCAEDSYSYEKAGIYKARLKVTDNKGAINTDVITITVN